MCGTGVRLEYLLVPLVFGLGAPMVALVGTNIGAGQQRRALRIALTGSALAFILTEAIGVAAAIWPAAWLELFGSDPRMLATGVAYLHYVGPTYGFFGLGLSLYCASQGAGRLGWPLLAGLGPHGHRGRRQLGNTGDDGIADVGVRRIGRGVRDLRRNVGDGSGVRSTVSACRRRRQKSLNRWDERHPGNALQPAFRLP